MAKEHRLKYKHMRDLNEVSIRDSYRTPFKNMLDKLMVTQENDIIMHPMLKKLKVPGKLFNLSTSFCNNNNETKKHIEQV